MPRRKPKVLMFCTRFFGYDKRIATALREEGFHVDLYDERPGTGFFSKVCVRLNLSLYRPVTRRYIEQVIAEAPKRAYDYVFVVKGEALNASCIELLRRAYPKAKFILYLWDSVENIPDCKNKIPLYDRVLTFDPLDAEKYSLIFRPMFSCDEYVKKEEGENKNPPAEYEYDFAFVGTAHSERPKIAKLLGKERREAGRNFFAFLYLPHPMLYYYNKLFNRAYYGGKKKEISFTPLSSEDIRKIYEKSRCVLDVEHSKQRGLTLRPVELLGMKKKIITTNALVKEYDFYHPDNIFIIDRANPKVDPAFWETEYRPIPEEIQKRYSFKEFIRVVFDLEEKNINE